MDKPTEITDMVVAIVSAYVGHNSVPASEVPALIQSVHGALKTLSTDWAATDQPAKAPAVSIKKSIGTDYLICLEDGRKFKSLKRHLATKYNLTPDAYRTKWNLPKGYPMVAPAYAQARSNLAKQMGLGQGGRKAAVPAKPARGRA